MPPASDSQRAPSSAPRSLRLRCQLSGMSVLKTHVGVRGPPSMQRSSGLVCAGGEGHLCSQEGGPRPEQPGKASGRAVSAAGTEPTGALLGFDGGWTEGGRMVDG